MCLTFVRFRFTIKITSIIVYSFSLNLIIIVYSSHVENIHIVSQHVNYIEIDDHEVEHSLTGWVRDVAMHPTTQF